MEGLVKNVLVLVGTLVLSLLLFNLAFGDVSKKFMWDAMEPAFQNNWELSTFKDGEMVSDVLTQTFQHTKDISE